MARRRLIDALPSEPQQIPRETYSDTVVDADFANIRQNYEYLLAALRSRAPGQWSQNLLELSRHFTSSAYLAIDTLATQAADAEAIVYERSPYFGQGDIPLPWTEPIVRLLENPNDDDSLGDLLYQIVQQLSLTGIALIWMPTLEQKQIPQELYVIPSASALPWPPSPIHPHGSYLVQPYYPYGPFSTIPSYQSAAGARIPGEQIIRIKKHHPQLRYDGYAVLTALKQQIDTIDAIDMARWQTQQNGTDPTLILEFEQAIVDPKLEELNRLRARIEAIHAGPLGKKSMMIPPGMKASPVGHSPKDMSWIEGWNQLTKFVMAGYGVPSIVAGMHDATNDRMLLAAQKQFYVRSLNPVLRTIADKTNKRLIRPYFGDELYLKLTGRQITDEDLLERQLALDMKVQGARTVDEYRKVRGLPPLGPPIGNQWISQASTLIYEGVHGGGGKPAKEEAKKKKSLIRQLDDKFAPERLALAFEKAKTNGTALPLERNGTH